MKQIFISLAMVLFMAGAQALARVDYPLYPLGAIPEVKASGNSPNAPISLSLSGVPNHITMISGFSCAGGGATAAGQVALTIASLKSTPPSAVTISYPVIFEAGALNFWVVEDKYSPPLPANGPGQTITLLLPALGAGNLYAFCRVWGFQAQFTGQ